MTATAPERVDVAVVGGGLTGLSVAHRVARASKSVAVLEAGERWGGQIWTARTNELVVEIGAEGFVARSESMVTLARELGIEERLIDQRTLVSYGWDGGPLVELGPGEAARLLGFQVTRDDLGRGVRTFRSGTADVIDALVRSLEASPHVSLRARTSASRVSRGRVDHAGGMLEAGAVVIATPARIASSLLEAWGAPARALATAPLLSSINVTLAYRAAAFPRPLAGSGLVVAEQRQEHGFRACAFTSEKLPHRAPPGTALLRVFFRPPDAERDGTPDALWAERATACVVASLGATEAPTASWVSRWPDALPVFEQSYRDAVHALEAALPQDVLLAGSAFHGAGIDAAVRSAFTAADRALAQA